MDEEQLALSIDGSHPVEVRVQRPRAVDWLAGPIPAGIVNVEAEEHLAVITAGDRAGLEAVGHHRIDRRTGNTYLAGTEAFQEADPNGDPNVAAYGVMRRATEGR